MVEGCDLPLSSLLQQADREALDPTGQREKVVHGLSVECLHGASGPGKVPQGRSTHSQLPLSDPPPLRGCHRGPGPPTEILTFAEIPGSPQRLSFCPV